MARSRLETDGLYTVAEAAALTALPIKRINKLADEQLPKRAVRKEHGRRLITFDGLVCLALDEEISANLTVASRKQVFRRIVDAPGAREVAGGSRIKVEVAETRRALSRRRRRLDHAMRNLVRSDADVLGGALCFSGTRIPVHLVAELSRQGASTEELQQDYPTLTAEMIEAAPMIAQAHPKRGRPPKQPWHGNKVELTRKVPASI